MKYNNEILFLDADNIFPKQLSPELEGAMKSVRFIAQHIKDADKENEVGFCRLANCRCFFCLVSDALQVSMQCLP